MKVSVSQIEWHDATIMEIDLSSISDAFDRFRIRLSSEAFLQDFGRQDITITISNCYKIRMELNLWGKGLDTIGEATLQKESSWIINEQQSICKPKSVQHFKLVTNFNSIIEALVTTEDCVEVTVE